MEIIANVVTVDEGVPVVIGFGDDNKNPVDYLLLQYDPTEKDAGLHIEMNDQIKSGYNLVQRVRLGDSSVHIELTSTGNQVLKTDSGITVLLSARVRNWPSLKTKVAQLLDGIVPIE